jgi:signal transduction histidine kinase
MLGTGLEIPLAKQVIEAHHGTLAINTGANPRNTLTLTLPVR